MAPNVMLRFTSASVISSVACLLSLVALPTGLLRFPDAASFLLSLIIAVIVPLVVRQGIWLAAVCVGVSVCVLVTAMSERDFLGCATIDARVAQSVCLDDAGFRQFPPYLAAFLLLVRLVAMGATFAIRSRRNT